jgi:hypothetical protein
VADSATDLDLFGTGHRKVQQDEVYSSFAEQLQGLCAVFRDERSEALAVRFIPPNFLVSASS